MRCPSCGDALEAGMVGEASVAMCRSCLGTLVAQRRLIPLLTALSSELAEQMDVDHPITPLADSGARDACPGCGQTLERFGYMETRLATAGRCGPCGVVWASTDELGVMALLFARTRRRREARQAHLDAELESLGNRVHLALRARFRSDGVTGSLVGLF